MRGLTVAVSSLPILALAACIAAASPQAASVSGTQSVQISAGRNETPVPVPEPSEKALSYYRSGNVLWAVGLVWGILLPCLFLFTGFSARIRDWARKLGRKWFVVGSYFTVFLHINFVLDLPLSPGCQHPGYAGTVAGV